MVTEFIFVRHGETNANRDGILQGNIDVPLNDNGIRQAHVAAEYLADTCFDAAYSSPLKRAALTAEIVIHANKHPLKLELSDSLREWHCGKLDGLTLQEINANYPAESKSFCFEQIETVMPEGESGWEFQKRITDFLEQLRQKHAGQKILLVAHGGVLQRIFRTVAGVVSAGNVIPLAGNASVSSFIYNHQLNAWQLTSWNRTDHLAGIPQHISRVH